MAKSKPCKYCEQPITFEQVNDRWIPYNIDGTAHKCASGARTERPQDVGIDTQRSKTDTATDIVPLPKVTTMPTPTDAQITHSKLDTIIMLLTAIKENL